MDRGKIDARVGEMALGCEAAIHVDLGALAAAWGSSALSRYRAR
jgi:hypothetical protein